MYTLYTKLILIPLMIICSLLTLSSNSVMFNWMMLELSSMAFIFMIILNNSTLNKWQAALSYFIIQSISSTLLIPMLFYSETFFMKSNLIINIILMVKVGLTPFHSWIPWIMSNLSWMTCFIMVTLQKIIPLLLISYFANLNLLILFALLTVLISSIMIMKSLTLKKIMAYSSISNSGWMILVLTSSSLMMLLYLCIYSINSYIIFKIFHTLNLNLISDFNKFNTTLKWNNKLLLIFSLFSMGGLPPFMGFLMKLFAISSFKFYSPLMMMVVILSLINLFSYINVCWNIMFIIEPSTKTWYNFQPLIQFKSILLIMILLGIMSFWIILPIFIY